MLAKNTDLYFIKIQNNKRRHKFENIFISTRQIKSSV